MKPEQRFLRQPKSFWALVRSISQQYGYTKNGQVRVPTPPDIVSALQQLELDTSSVEDQCGCLTDVGRLLLDYFSYRATLLNEQVEPLLMDVEQARRVFEELYAELSPACPIPNNKQKGDKKAPAYLTSIVNMLIEAHSEGLPCDYDPRKLTTVTRDGVPLRTLARRVDGAFPSTVNPTAVWEIKEYYYTTTFGSRVADGVYETLLDGMELEELKEYEGVNVKHYLIVDSHYTWWECGKSYLCRIIDMLHMGYVDEVLFGCEVVDRLPVLVKEWIDITKTYSG